MEHFLPCSLASTFLVRAGTGRDFATSSVSQISAFSWAISSSLLFKNSNNKLFRSRPFSCNSNNFSVTSSLSPNSCARKDFVPNNGSPKPFSFSHRRSEEHTSELQSQFHLVCRLLLE